MDGLSQRLQHGELDPVLQKVYGAGKLSAARGRCCALLNEFRLVFQQDAQALFRAPGRTELGGNHTDHQHGRVLAASVDLDMLAAVAMTDRGQLRVHSQGYPSVCVCLSDLSPREDEQGTTAALVRGVAAHMAALGCPVKDAGLDICVFSDVPGGSGLSSSAAFEVLMGTVLNDLFWNGHLTPMEIAQVGQRAENQFFGKPCGLMDQAASSLGGVVAMDFEDPSQPAVESLPLDLATEGYALCILDSGADHADLTQEYSAITRELHAVAQCFGRQIVRDVDEQAFLRSLPRIRKKLGDRAVLRALHVFSENRRAAAQAAALKRGDFSAFLTLVDLSGRSSAMYLQNVIPGGQTHRQELMLTLALCEQLLEGRGAVRVHGGGFGGTAQAYVPLECLDTFRERAEAALGAGHCRTVNICPVGSIRLS